MAVAAAAKDALRRTMGAQLAALSPAEIAAQSAGVLSQLLQLPFYLSARSASVYLPMDRGCEVNTWPIIADLLGRGATVAVPRVVGPAPGDMEMLAIRTIEEAQAFPRTKWGIPEPDDAAAATMERLTDVPLDLILVPGVAFDAQCNRLGHGRGYYDTFLARQRAAAEAVTSSSDAGAATSRTDATIVGLALTPQLVVRVPTGEHDERLQFIVHPAGRLAYTSAADAAGAAALFDGSNGADAASGGAASSSSIGIDELVDVAKGVYKYACVRVSGDGRRGRDSSYLVVRSGRGDYHSHVAKPVVDRYRRQGLMAEPLGGGRISFTDSVSGSAKIHIYGFSVGFGGDEGGPPGAGMSDHVEVARLVALRYPDAAVTFSPDGVMAHAFRIVRGADAGEASKQYVMTFRRFASRQPSLRGDRLRMRKLCERYASGRVSWRYEQELLQSMLAQPDWAISDDGDAGNRWLGTEEQQEDSGSQYFVLRQTAPGVMEATVLDATCDFTHVNPAPSERGAGGGSSSSSAAAAGRSRSGAAAAQLAAAAVRRRSFLEQQHSIDIAVEKNEDEKINARFKLSNNTDFAQGPGGLFRLKNEGDGSGASERGSGGGGGRGRGGGSRGGGGEVNPDLEAELSEDNEAVENLYEPAKDQVNVEEDRLTMATRWVDDEWFEVGTGADAAHGDEEDAKKESEEEEELEEDDSEHEEDEEEEGTEGGGFKSRKRARRDGSDAGSAESSAAPALKKKKKEEDSSDTSKFVKEKDVQKSLMGEKGYTIELKVLKRRYKGLHKSRPEIKKQVHAELVRHIGKLCIVEGKQLTLKPEHRH